MDKAKLVADLNAVRDLLRPIGDLLNAPVYEEHATPQRLREVLEMIHIAGPVLRALDALDHAIALAERPSERQSGGA